nr:ABC transporter I family member 10, chloroplastic [Tanacetum cinerariifolium]
MSLMLSEPPLFSVTGTRRAKRSLEPTSSLKGLLSPTDGFMHVRKPRSFVFQNPDHQVVMPNVEANVAFGLGRFNLTNDETKLRIAKALTAVGMYDYLQ